MIKRLLLSQLLLIALNCFSQKDTICINKSILDSIRVDLIQCDFNKLNLDKSIRLNKQKDTIITSLSNDLNKLNKEYQEEKTNAKNKVLSFKKNKQYYFGAGVVIGLLFSLVK